MEKIYIRIHARIYRTLIIQLNNYFDFTMLVWCTTNDFPFGMMEAMYKYKDRATTTNKIYKSYCHLPMTHFIFALFHRKRILIYIYVESWGDTVFRIFAFSYGFFKILPYIVRYICG